MTKASDYIKTKKMPVGFVIFFLDSHRNENITYTKERRKKLWCLPSPRIWKSWGLFWAAAWLEYIYGYRMSLTQVLQRPSVTRVCWITFLVDEDPSLSWLIRISTIFKILMRHFFPSFGYGYGKNARHVKFALPCILSTYFNFFFHLGHVDSFLAQAASNFHVVHCLEPRLAHGETF